MTSGHLDEMIIQQFAEGKDPGDEERQHLSQCGACMEKLAVYRLLFKGIRDQPAPSLEIDLASIMPQEAAPGKPRVPWIRVFLIPSVICLLSIFLQRWLPPLEAIFKGLSAITSSLIILSFLCIVIFQFVEMINKYHRQMNSLK